MDHPQNISDLDINIGITIKFVRTTNYLRLVPLLWRNGKYILFEKRN